MSNKDADRCKFNICNAIGHFVNIGLTFFKRPSLGIHKPLYAILGRPRVTHGRQQKTNYFEIYHTNSLGFVGG
jgi:hypothetical protein